MRLLEHDDTFCDAECLYLGEIYHRLMKCLQLVYYNTIEGQRRFGHLNYTTSMNRGRSCLFLEHPIQTGLLHAAAALRKKVLRANYQAYVNRHCTTHGQEVPSSNGQRWIVTDPDVTEIDWIIQHGGMEEACVDRMF